MQGWLYACLHMEVVYCPKTVTHPSTNRAQCRVTLCMQQTTLPLHQTTTCCVGKKTRKWVIIIVIIIIRKLIRRPLRTMLSGAVQCSHKKADSTHVGRYI